MASEKKKRVLIPVGKGSSLFQTACLFSTLGKFGALVFIASVDEILCEMSEGAKLQANMHMDEAGRSEDGWDLIVLPGGVNGAHELRKSVVLIELLRRQKRDNKLYAALGCSPAIVLASFSDLAPPGATCFPRTEYREKMTDPSDFDIVIQNNVVTAKGNGCALLFALQLGEMLFNKVSADKAANALLVDRDSRLRYTYGWDPMEARKKMKIEPSGSVNQFNAAAKERIMARVEQLRTEYNNRNKSKKDCSPETDYKTQDARNKTNKGYYSHDNYKEGEIREDFLVKSAIERSLNGSLTSKRKPLKVTSEPDARVLTASEDGGAIDIEEGGVSVVGSRHSIHKRNKGNYEAVPTNTADPASPLPFSSGDLKPVDPLVYNSLADQQRNTIVASISTSSLDRESRTRRNNGTAVQHFHDFIWPALVRLGWRSEVGNRPNDRYYFPPGIERSNKKNRVDYFDSVSQVMKCIEGTALWKEEEIIASQKILPSPIHITCDNERKNDIGNLSPDECNLLIALKATKAYQQSLPGRNVLLSMVQDCEDLPIRLK